MSILRRRMRSRLVVTMKSGETFDGVLYEQDRQTWVLRNTQVIQQGRGPTPTTVPLDGEVILLTADVAFAQRP